MKLNNTTSDLLTKSFFKQELNKFATKTDLRSETKPLWKELLKLEKADQVAA